MQTEITWWEVATRLLLSFGAGAVLGANRGQLGRAAGLRTTVLVCMTASASMILANLLLGTTGKSPDSFVSMDVMRFPLGILTGMGFIGAGAILHKENMILGVTTAATLWFTTLMGFCFGSGESALGLSLLGFGVFTLWCLEWVELRWKQNVQAVLTLVVSSDGPSQHEVTATLEAHGYKLSAPSVRYSQAGQELRYEIHWRASRQDTATPNLIVELAERPGVRELHWRPSLVTG
jgi:putative Mg2+ transporter-C (MgtC) family protein